MPGNFRGAPIADHLLRNKKCLGEDYMHRMPEGSASLLRLLSVAVLATMAVTAARAHDNGERNQNPEPLVLEAEGSLLVGGQ